MTDHRRDEHSNPRFGPLIRLWGIRTDQLPPVPGKEGTDSNADKLTQFLASLLREAVPFIDSVAPKGNGDGDIPTSTETSPPTKKRKTDGWKPKGTKSYHPESAAKVDLYERVIGPKELGEAAGRVKATTGAGETWVCRRSVHEDKKEKGTASWGEFWDCFKERHAETEELFTPSVVKMEKRVVWDCSGVPPQTFPTSTQETYTNFTLTLIEARHRIGKPLKDRAFPILQMTCSVVDKYEFLVISVTVPDYFTSDGSGSSKQQQQDVENTVVGSYASIERIRKIYSSSVTTTTTSDPNHKIEWLMALTSNAGGILPQWVQNLAVPGQISKDVRLFLGWIAQEREKVVSSA